MTLPPCRIVNLSASNVMTYLPATDRSSPSKRQYTRTQELVSFSSSCRTSSRSIGTVAVVIERYLTPSASTNSGSKWIM
jgi:hypothetical protein